MRKKTDLESIFHKYNLTDFKRIDAKDIVIAQWVRFKCMFGCDSYGQKASCPPNTPPINECREFFSEYEYGVVYHFEKYIENPESRSEWTNEMNKKLLLCEQEIFLSGYQKAFLLFLDECCLCRKCTGSRILCMHKKLSRPGADALGVDVYSTVRKLGYPIEVLKDYNQTMNRYSFLLIE
ncbi:MAG: DUF2284 domain-containing protein [Spirochaetales bacterium]|nr:DUF2284 domain-containing protein [Spirochaetales bacterium]